MPDIEKVIKGFECCHIMVHDLGEDKTCCGICPYKDVQTQKQIDLGGIECVATLHDDALELLYGMTHSEATDWKKSMDELIVDEESGREILRGDSQND